MSKPLVIFGTGKIADVVYYYATEECKLKVVAFTVDEKYKKAETFHGLPVIPFESLSSKFPSATHDVFVAVGYQDLNSLRERKLAEVMEKGYTPISIISPMSNVPKNVGFGYNCFIMPPAIIHPCVTLGNNVFVWSGSMVGHHSVIGDNCWLTSACNIAGNVTVGRNTFFAVNSTVAHSVSIGERCFLGANTLVTKNLPAEAVVMSESSKPIRLNSSQFLRMSGFSDL